MKAKKKNKKVAKKNIKTKTVKKSKQKVVKKVAAKKIVKKNTKKQKAAKEIKNKKPIKNLKTQKIKEVAKKAKKIEAPKTAAKNTAKKEITTKNNVIDLKEKFANKTSFKTGEYVVYPSHGIGKIIDVETMMVLGQDFSCYLIYFEKEKLTIKVPLNNVAKIGLRPLVSKQKMEEVISLLRSGVKKMKGMWSRRAQEYEAKINSGDIMALAEVLRDLTRDIEDGERSYSERIIYETAVARLAAEYCAIYNTDFEETKAKIISIAKDKIASENKETKVRKDEFDDTKDEDELEEDEMENEDDEDMDDEDYEDEDMDDEDDAPKKRRR